MDNVAATEIRLWIENNEPLYRQGLMILKNLYRKHKRGILDKAKAPKLLMYLVEAGLKSYAKEYGDAKEWSKLLSVADRKELAAELAKEYIEQIESGEFEKNYPELVGKRGIGDEPTEILLPKWVKRNKAAGARRAMIILAAALHAGGTISVLHIKHREYKILVTAPSEYQTSNGHKLFDIHDMTSFFGGNVLPGRISKNFTILWREMSPIEHVIGHVIREALGINVTVNTIR